SGEMRGQARPLVLPATLPHCWECPTISELSGRRETLPSSPSPREARMATTQNTARKRRAGVAANVNGKKGAAPKVSPDVLLEHYREMVLVRIFEEACQRAFRQGRIGGYLHVYIGQEAVAAGFLHAFKE